MAALYNMYVLGVHKTKVNGNALWTVHYNSVVNRIEIGSILEMVILLLPRFMIPCAVETCNTAKVNKTHFLFKTIPKFSSMLLSNKFICLTLDSSIKNKSSKENTN